MSTRKLQFAILVFTVLLLTHSVSAQWTTDTRLTNNVGASSLSLNNSRCIAISGQTIHLVWEDARTGGYEVYYKCSTNGGASWQPDARLSNGGSGYSSSIAVNGSVVHVVWEDTRHGYMQLYYKRSTTAGLTWGAEERFTNTAQPTVYPSIGINGSFVHVVWEDHRNGDSEIYHKRSTNGGDTWEAVQRVTNAVSYSEVPSVYVLGSNVHIAWQDTRDGNHEIYYNRSTNGGASFTSDIRITNNADYSGLASIAGSGSNVHIVWNDERDGNREIYHKNSTDHGVTWLAVNRLTNNAESSYGPVVAVYNSNVHVIWKDQKDAPNLGEIYYRFSSNSGNTWNTDLRLTNDTNVSRDPQMAISEGALHVMWSDLRDNNYEIYYKKNPTGNPVAVNNISTEVPKQFSLSQNYPNPFNPVTSIEFSITESANTSIIIYDALGREVETLVNENLSSGVYKTEWNASKYNSGVYFCKMVSGEFTDTKKIILAK